MDKHKFVEFNINDYVWVKLTAFGREAHLKDSKAFWDMVQVNRPYHPPKEDEEGWSCWQLWHLESTFGQLHHMGGELPYKTTIRLAKEDLKEV